MTKATITVEVDVFQVRYKPDTPDELPDWVNKAQLDDLVFIINAGKHDFFVMENGKKIVGKFCDWLVRYPDGHIILVTRENFHSLYTPGSIR